MWDFPSERHGSEVNQHFYVNDKESEHFINHPLQDGYHYKGVFTTKAYDDVQGLQISFQNKKISNCRLCKK